MRKFIDTEELTHGVDLYHINESSLDILALHIKEYGWNTPIIIDQDNVIIKGHARYEAAKKLGLKKILVEVE